MIISTQRDTPPAIIPMVVFALFILGLVTSVPSGAVRLLQGDATASWASQVFKLTVAPMAVLSCAGVLLLLARRTLRVDGLSIALIAFCALSTVVGLFGTIQGTNLPAHAVNHLGSMALVVGLYLLGLNLHAVPIGSIRKGIEIYSGTSVVVYSLSLAAYVIARSTGKGYWGFGVDVLLAVTWYIASRRPIPAFFASALILTNGKRMYTVGWFVAAGVMLIHARRKRGWRWMSTRAILAGFLGGLALCALIAAFATGLIAVPHFFQETVKKWGEIGGSAGNFSLDRASAGRLTDLLRAWHFLQEDPIRSFVGGGIGLWWWDRGADYNQAPVAWQTHYTHFSPLNFVVLAGWPMALAIFLAVVWTLVRTWRRLPFLDPRTEPVVLALLAFVTARLVEGFFANLYFSDGSFWFAFGAMSAACFHRGDREDGAETPADLSDRTLAEPAAD